MGSITCVGVSTAGTVWAINERLSITLRAITEAFNCFARSTAYLTAFRAVFEPSVGTRIFETINPPLIRNNASSWARHIQDHASGLYYAEKARGMPSIPQRTLSCQN